MQGKCREGGNGVDGTYDLEAGPSSALIFLRQECITGTLRTMRRNELCDVSNQRWVVLSKE